MGNAIESGRIELEDECRESQFDDARLTKRFRALLAQLSERPGASIPFACQDWANTKAAYRFLSNPRVTEAHILRGHFSATRDRFTQLIANANVGVEVSSEDSMMLVLHDTTELSYRREDATRVGMIGKLADYTQCGVMMHSALVITTEGLPLGLAAAKFWTRSHFKGTNALKRKINPTRIPIEQKESFRWLHNVRESTQLLADASRCVHIGDRESDIYELFCQASALGTHFLLRTCVDRLAGDGRHTIADEMQAIQCKGLHRIEIVDNKGKTEIVELEIKYRRLRVLPPIGKQKRYPPLDLTVLHATERVKANVSPKARPLIDWKLITDLPIDAPAQAVEKLRWYALRWKIEVFHKVLKSGCKVEEAKLRSAQRLTNLIALQCILAWRIFWLTMVNRAMQQASATLVFTVDEIAVFEALMRNKKRGKPMAADTAQYRLTQLAKLGGYLARTRDPPPGNMVIWRGLQRLHDIALGFTLKVQLVGN
jgi:Transposase DNA-binding/Transposase Tn5 dimerisation domain